MLTLALYGLLAIAIMAALFFIAANFLPAGEQVAPSVRDEAPWDLPMSRPLDATDVASIRLPVALRGYRFAETDVLLDRLGEELRSRDAEIARLRGAAAAEPEWRSLDYFRPPYDQPAQQPPDEPADDDEPTAADEQTAHDPGVSDQPSRNDDRAEADGG